MRENYIKTIKEKFDLILDLLSNPEDMSYSNQSKRIVAFNEIDDLIEELINYDLAIIKAKRMEQNNE